MSPETYNALGAILGILMAAGGGFLMGRLYTNTRRKIVMNYKPIAAGHALDLLAAQHNIYRGSDETDDMLRQRIMRDIRRGMAELQIPWESKLKDFLNTNCGNEWSIERVADNHIVIKVHRFYIPITYKFVFNNVPVVFKVEVQPL